MFKPISISLSPNTEKDDVLLALKLIFRPWKWKSGLGIKILEEEFKKYLGVKYAISFNSGRSSFLAILKSLNLSPDDEVLLQAFTCNAVANPIIWAGLKPVYVDCNEDDFNIDIEDLKRKVTERSRPARNASRSEAGGVVVIQHTFGLPANIDEVLKICNQNNLTLIEDCAHSLGAEYRNKKVGLSTDSAFVAETTSAKEATWAKAGTFGKASFFSFSRDKVISSVYGGVAVTNDPSLAEKLRQYQDKLGYPSYFWIFQQLLHPILMNFIILPLYRFLDLGKIFLVLSQWFHILSKAVHWKEKRGKKPDYFPKRLPNVLAILALNQFKKLEKFNSYREKVANFYYGELKNNSFELPKKFPERKNIFLRFTIKHKMAHEIIWEAWHKQNILIGDWYTSPIAPEDTKLEKVFYTTGTCPKAEKLSKITLNLPTHINISENDVERIVKFLKKF